MDVLNQANQKALASIQRMIDGLNLPTTQKSFLKELIPKIDPNIHLFKLQGENWAPVVEVTTTITIEARPRPNIIRVLLDVDIPPPPRPSDKKPPQKPHIGCEVYLNGTRCGNDHIWIEKDILHAGRPQFGRQLEEYGWFNDVLESSLPEGTRLDVKFKRYKGLAQNSVQATQVPNS